MLSAIIVEDLGCRRMMTQSYGHGVGEARHNAHRTANQDVGRSEDRTYLIEVELAVLLLKKDTLWVHHPGKHRAVLVRDKEVIQLWINFQVTHLQVCRTRSRKETGDQCQSKRETPERKRKESLGDAGPVCQPSHQGHVLRTREIRQQKQPVAACIFRFGYLLVGSLFVLLSAELLFLICHLPSVCGMLRIPWNVLNESSLRTRSSTASPSFYLTTY